MTHNSGKDFLINLHLDLPPYNQMEISEALEAIKRHCGIPIDYVSKYDTTNQLQSNIVMRSVANISGKTNKKN